jgi:hypothetical protein
MTDQLHEVGSAMAAMGLNVDQPVRLVLRPAAELRSRGLMDHNSPDTLGVTHSTRTGGRSVGPVTIAIVAGLPDDLFRAVLAHEYGHAYLAGLPQQGPVAAINKEGFCESLAYEYLASSGTTTRQLARARQMMSGADEVYGDGLRLVYPSLRRWGAPRVASEIASGHPVRVGLDPDPYGS